MAQRQLFPRRFERRRRPIVIVWAVLLLLVALRFFGDGPTSAPPTPLAEGEYRVTQVIDGDTLVIEGQHTIRLMGVDTPETVKRDHPVEPWGPQASDFTRDFIAPGKVRLQFDRERVDQYGRLLAYVYVGDRLLNEELVRAGLARFEPKYRYAEPMKRRFRAAQEEARAASRGIWSARSIDAQKATAP